MNLSKEAREALHNVCGRLEVEFTSHDDVVAFALVAMMNRLDTLHGRVTTHVATSSATPMVHPDPHDHGDPIMTVPPPPPTEGLPPFVPTQLQGRSFVRPEVRVDPQPPTGITVPEGQEPCVACGGLGGTMVDEGGQQVKMMCTACKGRGYIAK